MDAPLRNRFAAVISGIAFITACQSGTKAPASGTTAATGTAADSSFTTLARAIIDDHMARRPSAATDLGVHKFDDRIEDASQAAIQAASKAFGDFRAKLTATDTSGLSETNRADREFLIRSMDAGLLANDVIRRWAKDPDSYSGAITNAAYTIMKRNFAPAADRLKSLIARERLMPATLVEARRNLANPPKIYSQIAIEQIDGNIAFFKNDVPSAFAEVTGSVLVRSFKQTNDSVMAALASYKSWLRKDLLPESNGSYAYGADTYAKALVATRRG